MAQKQPSKKQSRRTRENARTSQGQPNQARPNQLRQESEARVEASFLLSAPDLAHCPPETGPEVAFAGRSNAGKSSVLNQIAGQKALAKVSKTPGRTQLINFFDVNKGGRLVDLPGYGYAKAGRAAQREWQAAVNEYLSHRSALAGLILVMDCRHPHQDFDAEMLSWAAKSELPTHVLLNKSDKLGNAARSKALKHMRSVCSDYPLTTLQLFSALKGSGKNELLNRLTGWLAHQEESS